MNLVLRQIIANLPLPRSRFVWMALQVPVLAALNLIYSLRPVTDPTVVNYDVRLFFDAATAFLRGQLPYRDFFFQYPPLALIFLVPPRWFAADLASYFSWFNIELLILACVGILAATAVADRIGQPLGPTLFVYSLSLLALGAIVPQRYDLAPAIIVVSAIAAWLNERQTTAYLLLAIGMLTKIYPVLLLPLFAIADWRTRGKPAVVRGLLVFVGMILLVLLPFLLLAPRETLTAFGEQAGRGVGIASVYATLLLAARSIGVPAEIAYQQDLNTWNVNVHGAEWLTPATMVLQLLFLALVYLLFLRSSNDARSALVPFAAATIGVGLVTSKVLSAQYIIWLFPLATLVGNTRFVWASALFLATALLTQLLYPFLWDALKQGTTAVLLVALGRDICLIALCMLLVRNSRSKILGVKT
jgi:hypothetical protein